MSTLDSICLPTAVGFIGLGAMGKPMAINLARKLPQGSHIYVHDVVASAINELLVMFPEKLVNCHDAKEVAEKSVLFYLAPILSHAIANL